jgi:predicted enzyme related to lactoylglutathione lyase
MEKGLGIGGVFFKARDKKALAAWYRDHLGVPVDESWGGVVFPNPENEPEASAQTHWSPFDADTTYFAPSTAPFMLNFRVRDLDTMIAQLRAAGCDVDDKREESEFGRFGWVMDPEGNRVELWQPPAS